MLNFNAEDAEDFAEAAEKPNETAAGHRSVAGFVVLPVVIGVHQCFGGYCFLRDLRATPRVLRVGLSQRVAL
jgi:hypothetical protein